MAPKRKKRTKQKCHFCNYRNTGFLAKSTCAKSQWQTYRIYTRKFSQSHLYNENYGVYCITVWNLPQEGWQGRSEGITEDGYNEISYFLSCSDGMPEKSIEISVDKFFKIELTNNDKKYPLALYDETPDDGQKFKTFSLFEWSLITIYKNRNGHIALKNIPETVLKTNFTKRTISSCHPGYRMVWQYWNACWRNRPSVDANTDNDSDNDDNDLMTYYRTFEDFKV